MNPYTFIQEQSAPIVESGIENAVVRKLSKQERNAINKAKFELINNPVITSLA